jgi:hypothetical protein
VYLLVDLARESGLEQIAYALDEFIFLLKHSPLSQAPVAHTCNPRYSGGRDQEDHGSKPAQANSLRDPISKILNTNKG